VEHVERHRFPQLRSALQHLADELRANAVAAEGRDEVKLAKMQPVGKLGHLHPADVLALGANDPRLGLPVAAAELDGHPAAVPAADLGQM
jgi:hypothetical protein